MTDVFLEKQLSISKRNFLVLFVVSFILLTIVGVTLYSANNLSKKSVSIPVHAEGTMLATSLPPIPAGIPSTFSFGLFNSNISTVHPSIPYNYRYQYLSGGVNTGNGWATWNTNG